MVLNLFVLFPHFMLLCRLLLLYCCCCSIISVLQVGAGVPPALAEIRQLVRKQLQAPPELVQVSKEVDKHSRQIK
jgi:hypothetical protein